MIVNKCYDTIIVLYISTILTEKGLNINMKIKPELNGNRVLECLKLKSRKISTAGETPPEPTPSGAPMAISFLRTWICLHLNFDLQRLERCC